MKEKDESTHISSAYAAEQNPETNTKLTANNPQPLLTTIIICSHVTRFDCKNIRKEGLRAKQPVEWQVRQQQRLQLRGHRF